jgi:predicted NBD/HSP70 family sugar kinase
LETEGSAPKIVKYYQELKPTKENLSTKDIAMRAKQGDKAATKAFARAGRFLGIGIGTAINLLNPEKVVLGGGVMEAGDLLLWEIKQDLSAQPAGLGSGLFLNSSALTGIHSRCTTIKMIKLNQ